MVRCIDSHTEGEPTRLVLSGFPDIPPGSAAEQAAWLDANAQDWMRSVVCEPRGHEAMVGALLLPGQRLIFFNNVGTLRMCGHGTIGVAATMAQLGMTAPGDLTFETPVGSVSAHVSPDLATVEIENVESWRIEEDYRLRVEGIGDVTGDIAWGGNGFFITKDCPIPLLSRNIPDLLAWTLQVRQALDDAGLTGRHSHSIDHVELSGPPGDPANSGRNFVLCPGAQFDRSPCGTGTSAKLACLAADGELEPGEVWRQESILGTVFEGSYSPGLQGIRPRIKGRAFVTSELTLKFNASDPLNYGINFQEG